MPDAALVTPCDTANGDPETTGQLATELVHTRRQRNDCAAQVDGVAKWRSDALKRGEPAK